MKVNFSLEHTPVLLKEVIENLAVRRGKKYVDATFGFGGHSLEILKKGGLVLGIEKDLEVLKLAKKHLKKHCPDAFFQLVKGDFSDLREIVEKNNFFPVSGVIFDLGISLWHYKKAGRGFSFDDQLLDMRLDRQRGINAFEIINSFTRRELYEIFTKFAQEKLAWPIAEAVVRARRLKKIFSAKDLAEIVCRVYRRCGQKTVIDPATKVFLALRIFVNQEFENLKKGLLGSFFILEPGGKILVISFNSGEDRIAKLFFRGWVKKGLGEALKPIFPDPKEVLNNPLSRSAKLRIFIKK